MADILPDLPFEELWGVLSKDTYPSFQSPKLTAFLRELYESLDRQISEPGDLHFYRTGILKCIYEVDPAMGREMIFKEIVSSRPRADIEVLRLLSDETLPEIDAELSRQLPETYENAGWHEFGAKLAIVERYATPAIVGSVKAVYLKDDGWHREREALFIAYFLRTEPAFGKYLIERHLKLGSSDSDTLLTDIEGVRPFPQLRDIAREHLYNPDKRIAANAAYVFKSMGNHDVELLLWNLLKAWHEAWANKTESIPFEEQSYQDALVEALLFGGGPCRSKEVLEKLRSIYIKGRSSNGNIELPPWHEPVIIIADARRASNPEFRVEFCGGPLTVEQLKTNIPQFPKGTEFEWRGDRRPEDAKLEAVFREIERLVETEGMSIHR